MQHVQASDRKSDSRKSDGKQCEHCQQFPHEIHLQRNQRCQEHPHPLSALVRGLHLSSVVHPPPLKTLAVNLCFPCCTFYLQLLRCTDLSRRSNHSPYLSHLTPSKTQRRWYSSHILDPKLLA